MTVLDKIRAFFQRGKPSQVNAGKPSANSKLAAANGEKPPKTAQVQKKAPKAAGRKPPITNKLKMKRRSLLVSMVKIAGYRCCWKVMGYTRKRTSWLSVFTRNDGLVTV